MGTPSFDKWDFLDPERMRAKLATAHGSAVWTNADMLDPHRQEAKINALHAGTFGNLRGITDTLWTLGRATVDANTARDHTLAHAIGSI